MLQLPPPPEDDSDTAGRRLWVGNIDEKITEFALLKLLQKYGDLEKFDFLYHKAGPDQGKPRGYCFVTYKTIQAAAKAEKSLNGKRALSKRLAVKPAHVEKTDLSTLSKPNALSEGSTSKKSDTCTSPKSQIKALESQLQQLQEASQSDIDAFLPATERKNVCSRNPMMHCLAGRNDGEPAKNSPSSSHRNQRYRPQQRHTQYRNHRPYGKHKR